MRCEFTLPYYGYITCRCATLGGIKKKETNENYNEVVDVNMDGRAFRWFQPLEAPARLA